MSSYFYPEQPYKVDINIFSILQMSTLDTEHVSNFLKPGKKLQDVITKYLHGNLSFTEAFTCIISCNKSEVNVPTLSLQMKLKII